MKERIKTVFQNFKLNIKPSGITRVYFVRSAWENLDIDKVSIAYVVHRTIFLLYFLIVAIHSLSVSNQKHIYFIYATRWSLWIQGFWATLYACHLYCRLYKERTSFRRKRPANDIELEAASVEEVDQNQETRIHAMNWIDSAVWILLSIVQTTPYTVSIGYWALVYNPNDTEHGIFHNLLTHGFNAILALIDLFVTGIPIRIAHFLYAFSFFVVYVAFSGIYEVAGGPYSKPEKPYIYSVLNWKEKPGKAWMFSFLSLVWVFILYTGIWLLYRLRSNLVVTCKNLSRKVASKISFRSN